jgi:hypothetical protein
MIYNVLDPILFAYIVKHEVYAVCNTWGLEYDFVITLPHLTSKNIVRGIICDDLNNISQPCLHNNLIQKLK